LYALLLIAFYALVLIAMYAQSLVAHELIQLQPFEPRLGRRELLGEGDLVALPSLTRFYKDQLSTPAHPQVVVAGDQALPAALEPHPIHQLGSLVAHKGRDGLEFGPVRAGVKRDHVIAVGIVPRDLGIAVPFDRRRLCEIGVDHSADRKARRDPAAVVPLPVEEDRLVGIEAFPGAGGSQEREPLGPV